MSAVQIPAMFLLAPNRVWRSYTGGRTLDELELNATPSDSHFAEDWIASTTLAVNPGRESIANEGYSLVEINGKAYMLKDLLKTHPDILLGDAHYIHYGAHTQLLLKLLDSAVRLHIQAHPTIAFAQKHLQSNSGKTEAYVILGSRGEIERPYVYLGFQHTMQREAFKQAVLEEDNDRLIACFEKIYIQPGDVFVVPGGLPHAIGEGVFMIEIMEPTDFVVRLESERGGYRLPEAARFMGRDIDFAMSIIDFNEYSVDDVRRKYFCEPLLVASGSNFEEHSLVGPRHTNCFSVNRLRLSDKYTRTSDIFHVGIVTKGTGIITAGNLSMALKRGDRFLIPYQTKEVTYQPEGEMELVFTFKEVDI